MNPKNIKKILLLNSIIIVANILLFSKAFLGLSFIAGSILSRSIAYFAVIATIYLFFNYNIKYLKKPPETRKMLSNNINSLDDCIQVFEVAIEHGDVFDEDCLKNIEQIKRFKRKKTTITDLLSQKFSKEELTYQKFSSVINNVENVMFLNMRSILNKIAAFDIEEYETLQKRGFPPSEISKEKLEIYNEYLNFVKQATKSNEDILLKLDKILFEITRYNSIDGQDVLELSAVKEMDELIKNAKLYK